MFDLQLLVINKQLVLAIQLREAGVLDYFPLLANVFLKIPLPSQKLFSLIKSIGSPRVSPQHLRISMTK